MKIFFQSPFRSDRPPSMVLLVTITMMGTIAMHMFIPAMPDTARDLHTTAAVVQLTVTMYVIGLAVGQLVYGPLSDRFGRRPVLLCGLLLFVLASAMAAMAGSIGELVVARVLQALGACSGLVLGRAMVRDVTTADKAAGSMAVLLSAISIAPALAPALGGYLVVWAGWRAMFMLLTLIAAGMLFWSVLALPETNRNTVPLPGMRAMFNSYVSLLRRPVFRGYALGGCASSTSLYGFFAASPFIFIDLLQRSPDEFGLYYLLIVATLSLGSLAASRLTRRFSIRTLTHAGNVVQIVASLALLVADRSGLLSVVWVLGPMMLYASGVGMAGSSAIAGAISADPKAIGAASGLYGCMQMLYAGLATLVVSLWPSQSALPVAVLLLASAIMARWAFRHAASARL